MVNIPFIIMSEIFKTCDFDNRYKISNLGNIKRVKSNGEDKLLKPSILNKNKTHPYYYIQIKREGKRKNYLIHRLVALAFCEGHSEINNVCDHIDRNTFNNKASNLRWGTQKDNMNNCILNKTEEEQKITRRIAQQRRSIKVECECGRVVAKYNYSAHLKSEIHSRLLSAPENFSTVPVR